MKLPVKITVASVCALLFMTVFGWAIFPKILKVAISRMVSLRKGNDVRDIFLKVPFPLTFKIYIFNVTNPSEVDSGEKPILQEIGPFVYDEWKEKVDIFENETDDTLTYTIKNRYFFNRKLSKPLTGQEIITMPHPLIVGTLLTVLREKPGAINIAIKGVNSIFANPTSLFEKFVAEEILFSGYTFYCNVTDFSGKAICSQFRDLSSMIEIEPGIYKFSLFAEKNNTKQQRVKVHRGIKNIHDLGRIIEYEGKDKLDIWSGDDCNTFKGTDSTIFPPFLKKEEGLTSFTPEVCRTLVPYYVSDTKYDGVPARKYVADFGDQSSNKDEKCYCLNECFKKGIFDLYTCMKVPLVASLPHFYLTDSEYTDAIKGLQPNKDQHEIPIIFEPMSGTPLLAKKRLQLNFPIVNSDKVPLLANVKKMIFPIMWVEEGVELNSTWTGQLKRQLFYVLKAFNVFKYLVLVGSVAGLIGAAYLHFGRGKKIEITPISKLTRHESNSISMVNSKFGNVNSTMGSNDINKF